jgi:hypothetical protein
VRIARSLDQRHQLGENRGPDLFSDVFGQFDHRCRAVTVEEVRDEHVVPVPGQFAGHLLQYRPDAEAVRVHQHSWVLPALAGEGGEGIGLAIRGGDLQCLGGQELPSSEFTRKRSLH